MSRRMYEQYNSNAQQMGDCRFFINNVELITRISSKPIPPISPEQALSMKRMKRSQYRILGFSNSDLNRIQIEQQYKYLFESQISAMNYQTRIKPCYSTSSTNLSKTPQEQCFSNIKNHLQIAGSNNSQHLSNNQDYYPIYVNKKISKDKPYKKNQILHYPSPPLPSASKGTSTEIVISAINRQTFTKLQSKPCIYPKKQSEKDSQGNQINKDANPLFYQNSSNRAYKEYEEGEEITIDSIIDEQGEDCFKNQNNCIGNNGGNYQFNRMNEQQFIASTIKRNNFSNLSSLNNNNNNHEDNNRNNNDINYMKPIQIWPMMGREEGKIFNQQTGNRKKEITLRGEYQSQILNQASQLPQRSDGQNSTLQERKINLNKNLTSASPNYTMNNNINNNEKDKSASNSDMFKMLSLEYKMIPKNNTLKNIKKAFIRYLFKTNRKQMIKKCEQFNLDIGHILTVLCQKIKYDHRHNKNIRFLLKSELISPLFKDFLMNSEDYWFSNSSLLNPGPCRQMVALLMKLSQNELLVDVIQEYEK